MLRLTEIKLPLGHPESDIKTAIIKKLGITANELDSYVVFKRSIDARKKNAIQYSYTLDVAVQDEDSLLERFKNDTHVRIKPDTNYHFVAHAPTNTNIRPVIIGMGPAGLLQDYYWPRWDSGL